MASSTPAPTLAPSLAVLTLSDGDHDGDDDDTPPLLDLLETFADQFAKEVLERLDPTDRTMLAQVGQPWLEAVLASGLPRLAWPTVRLQLEQLCTSAERVAWVKANGCPWGRKFVFDGGEQLLCTRRCRPAPGGAAVGAGAWLSVAHIHMFLRRSGQAHEHADVGESARLPVGRRCR
jgi:hypothetical protein